MGGFWLIVAGVGMGGGDGTVVAITPDGVDYRVPDRRPHYQSDDNRPHYQSDDNRPHYEVQ